MSIMILKNPWVWVAIIAFIYTVASRESYLDQVKEMYQEDCRGTIYLSGKKVICINNGNHEVIGVLK